MLKRWIDNNKIGFLAYLGYTLPVVDAGQLNGTLDRVLTLLECKLRDGPFNAPYPDSTFAEFPQHVLALLCRLAHTRRSDLLKQTEPMLLSCMERLTMPTAKHPPRLEGAQVLAYHFVYGRCSAKQLLRMARHAFSNHWKTLEGKDSVIAVLEEQLTTLRNPWLDLASYLQAIGDMSDQLDSMPGWAQTENALYHRCFCWPLVTLTVQSTIGMGLPLGINMRLNEGRRLRIIGGDGPIDVRKWTASLYKSIAVAKHLWRAKHGHYGTYWNVIRERVQIQYDFTYAQAFAASIGDAGIEHIPLEGRSAEACVAQAILSRLLGCSHFGTTAVTGVVGEQIAEGGEATLNYRVEPVNGFSEKLCFVNASTGMFQRFAYPAGNVHEFNAAEPNEYRAVDSSSAFEMHTMADIVQMDRWRQFRYVRCPEVEWGVHSRARGRPALTAQGLERAEALLQTLRGNPKPVLELGGVCASDVAHALWLINTRERARLRGRRYSGRPGAIENLPPPMLSWVFMKVLKEERGIHFWETLWSAIGAPPEEFNRFTQLSNGEPLASLLTVLLNKEMTEDGYWAKYRAPDILVLVDADQCSPSNTTGTLDPYNPLALLRRLQAADLLRGPLLKEYATVIGRTRVILLTDVPGEETEMTQVGIRLTGAEEEMRRLCAIFDWGFTDRMVSRLIGDTPAVRALGVRRVLEDLVRKDVLKEGQGVFHVPRDMGGSPEIENPWITAIEQYRAATALAPYARRRPVGTSTLGLRFWPEHITEALRHLQTAEMLCWRVRGPERRQKLLGSIQTLRLDITRFARIPSWDAVWTLADTNAGILDAMEVAEDLLSKERSSQCGPHPRALATFGWVLALFLRGNYCTDIKARTVLKERARGYFAEALKVCDSDNERWWKEEFAVRVLFAQFLAAEMPECAVELIEANQRALALARRLDPKEDSTWGSWFELAGDREAAHSAAADIYELGTHFSERGSLWFKSIGSLYLSGENEKLDAIREAFTEERAFGVQARAQIGMVRWSRTNGRSARWIGERWERGLDVFDMWWPGLRAQDMDAVSTEAEAFCVVPGNG